MNLKYKSTKNSKSMTDFVLVTTYEAAKTVEENYLWNSIWGSVCKQTHVRIHNVLLSSIISHIDNKTNHEA